MADEPPSRFIACIHPCWSENLRAGVDARAVDALEPEAALGPTSIRISYLSDWPMQARGCVSVHISVVYFTPSIDQSAGWNSVASVVPSPVGAEASLM